ncbi:MAG TPA: DsbA family protein [Gemmatimonadaceae bacterium]|nr:DsbA family protein [Gemmatimonadaceae bacterium]
MAQLLVPVSEDDHIDGSLDAPVILVEYGDFECPHCGHAYPIVKAAQRQLGDSLAVIWREFPLSEIHPHALHAAEASEAAGAQQKFWEMHDLLFEHQDALDDGHLLAYGESLGLDVTRYVSELANGLYLARVRSDFHQGVRSGVNGTPTFFINGTRFDGDWSSPEAFIATLSLAGGHQPASS